MKDKYQRRVHKDSDNILFRFCGCRNLPRTADAEQQHCSRARDLGGSGGSGGGGVCESVVSGVRVCGCVSECVLQ